MVLTIVLVYECVRFSKIESFEHVFRYKNKHLVTTHFFKLKFKHNRLCINVLLYHLRKKIPILDSSDTEFFKTCKEGLDFKEKT